MVFNIFFISLEKITSEVRPFFKTRISFEKNVFTPNLNFNHFIKLQQDENGTFTLDFIKYERRARSGVTFLIWRKSLGYWRTPGELNPSKGRAYNLSFVPARGECNIINNPQAGFEWDKALIPGQNL